MCDANGVTVSMVDTISADNFSDEELIGSSQGECTLYVYYLYLIRVTLNLVHTKGIDEYDLNDDFICDDSNGHNKWMIDNVDEDYVPSMHSSDAESSNGENESDNDQRLITTSCEEQDGLQSSMMLNNIETTEENNVSIPLDANVQCPIIKAIVDGLINKCLHEHKFDVATEDGLLNDDEMSKLRTAILLVANTIKQTLGEGVHNPVVQITLPLTVDGQLVEWEIKYKELQIKE